jgi:class 3 adenylate cyclase
LASRAAFEGERMQVTVLFADIKNSTELIKDLDPEAAQQLLDPALRRMMEAVPRYEGTVNQVLGHGICSRLQPAAARGLMRFVGREREIEVMGRAGPTQPGR